MKTAEQAQAAIDEIRQVCQKHGIVLLGVCYDEGIYGQIEIGDVAQLEKNDGVQITNTVEFRWDGEHPCVTGIG